MEISTQRQGPCAILTLNGHLTTHTGPAFAKHAREALSSGISNIVVDCANMGRISSAGLRELLVLVRTLREQQGRLAICNVTPAVRRTFEIAGMGSAFTFYKDRKQAIAELGG